ncbi:hypothetical protein HER17_07845 [Pectobacterium carotovorum]|uniref:hypothetical protein n=1 Tax=Pectobacterium TaxID=122277 RepID=UPI0001A44667|nr:hypothetical protein [Pectobacterium carotovorum]QLL92845.1 hypothetical protein HER17_07845 [Pectobacterium carotovorum]
MDLISNELLNEQVENFIKKLQDETNQQQSIVISKRNKLCIAALQFSLESHDYFRNVALPSGIDVDRMRTILSESKTDDDSVDFVFSFLFLSFMQASFRNGGIEINLISGLRDFVSNYKEKLSHDAQARIAYSLWQMPFDICRETYHSSDIKDFAKAAIVDNSVRKYMEEWISKVDEQREEVRRLSEILEEQEDAFNFVGLYKGFHNLSRAKRVEAKAALFNTRLFGFLTIIPLVFEIIVLTINSSGTWLDAFRIALIPAFALTFILAYYFRVSLSNYQSIKSQIVQIELRKTLCTFIQNYSVDIEKMTDKESLRKFENVVFSNIMPSEDKIPSTFDGIEQIAKLITSMKGK